MQSEQSLFFQTLAQEGTATLSELKSPKSIFLELYQGLNQILKLSSLDLLSEDLKNYDHYLKDYLFGQNLNLSVDSLRLERVIQGRVVPHIKSILYLEKYNSFLHEKEKNQSRKLKQFLTTMDEILHFVRPQIEELLKPKFRSDELILILKLSKYEMQVPGAFLMQPHKDRTLLTAVLDTEESSSGSLLLKLPNGKNKNVSEKDLPLIFAGEAGEKFLNLPPVTHSVLNFKEKNPKARFSVMLFILCREQLQDSP